MIAILIAVLDSSPIDRGISFEEDFNALIERKPFRPVVVRWGKRVEFSDIQKIKGLPYHLQVSMMCSHKTNELTGCVISDIGPDNKELRRAMLKLVKRYRLEDGFVRNNTGIGKIGISLDIYNHNVPKTAYEPCVSPFCMVEYMQPPPPPPSPQK